MNIKGLVARLRLKRAQRRTTARSFQFPADLCRPKRLLVCLPGQLRELTTVKQFLPQITSLFSETDITLLTMPDMKVADIFPRKGFHILSPTGKQLTWSGLPRKSYLGELRALKFDMILDLNLESTVFMEGILLGLSDCLRIGRGNFLGQPYYNLEIKTRHLRDGLNIYRSLLETLEGIKRNYDETITQSRT